MIRLATYNDIDRILEIKNEIVKEMQTENNPQWHATYPSKDDFLEDIKSNSLYVYDTNEVIGFICIKKDLDNEYEKLKESSNTPSFIIHRLGIKKEYRHQNIAYSLMKYAEELATNNNIYLIKADTEIKNNKSVKINF